jgi:hypothetical protein
MISAALPRTAVEWILYDVIQFEFFGYTNGSFFTELRFRQ